MTEERTPREIDPRLRKKRIRRRNWELRKHALRQLGVDLRHLIPDMLHYRHPMRVFWTDMRNIGNQIASLFNPSRRRRRRFYL